MDVGSICVSKREQNPELQRRELETAGCEKFFEERISSRQESRPQLEEAMDCCREGDRLVIWKLDRLGRSLKGLIELVKELQQRGVEFRSLRESLDATTRGGKLLFHVFSSIAESERDLIRERTMAGLGAARARGRNGGRPRSMDACKLALASRPMRDRETPISEVCKIVGVSKAALGLYSETVAA